MATLAVVAVRDRALDAFMRPFFVPSVGMAIRSFQDEVNRADKENAIYNHPEDYDLFHIASFDEDTGVFVNTPGGVKQLAIGKQCVISKE